MIDADGYRLNVGIILVNQEGRLFWAKRIGHKTAWQFPQGGIKENESPEDALYRELAEEIGLTKDDVEVLACTQGWLKYRLPKRYIRYYCHPLCIGQKQKWFLLRLKTHESKVRLDRSRKPEFDCFRWVYYWQPLNEVIPFKKRVYRQALETFSPLVGPKDSKRRQEL